LPFIVAAKKSSLVLAVELIGLQDHFVQLLKVLRGPDGYIAIDRFVFFEISPEL
jgi:hypothetical protein